MTDLEFIKQYQNDDLTYLYISQTWMQIIYKGKSPIIKLGSTSKEKEIEKLLFLKNKKIYKLKDPVLTRFYNTYYLYKTRQDVEIFLEILEIVVKSNIGYYYENEYYKPCSKKAFIDLCCQNLL